MAKCWWILFGLGILGCSSLQVPSYQKNAKGFQSQSDGYTDRAPITAPLKKPRGPFRLTYPVEKVKITRGFFWARRPHQGIDFDGNKNDPISAAHEGHVIYTGSDFRGFGKMVLIQYDDQWASLYAHLNSISVKEGKYIQMGDVIGLMGRTGRASGTHLHFELMRNKIPIDPMPWLTKNQQLVRSEKEPQ